jgi:hypothetical protein
MSKNRFTSILILMFCLSIVMIAQGQKPRESHSRIKGLNCSACHECAIPSKEVPCLKLGAQFFLGKGEKLTPQKLPPDTVIIDVLEDLYGPTKFPHKKHLHMAATTFDCSECHHYAPPSNNNPACKDCHSPYEMRPDLELVGLKAAYHRRCLTCHAQWSNNTNCELCHVSKDKEVAVKMGKLLPTFKEMKEPEKKVFLNRMFTGPYVTFFHQEHSKKKNVNCADCHKKWDCITCHYQGEEVPVTANVLLGTGVHGKCRLCHETIGKKKACNKCHVNEERLKPSTTDD